MNKPSLKMVCSWEKVENLHYRLWCIRYLTGVSDGEFIVNEVRLCGSITRDESDKLWKMSDDLAELVSDHPDAAPITMSALGSMKDLVESRVMAKADVKGESYVSRAVIR